MTTTGSGVSQQRPMKRPMATGLMRMCGAVIALAACSKPHSDAMPPPMPAPPAQLAFMSDIHLQDVYGKLGDFKGLPNRKSQKNATIRTMYAQLTSTRLFNENYFAFLAALDDAYARGVRHIALSGDYSDDAQPINIQGLKRILAEYTAKGVRFFVAPGNHDPNEPFDDEGAKDDFLGEGGKNQRVYSPNNGPCKGTLLGHVPDREHPSGPDIVCTQQIKESGYADILKELAEYGYMPSPQDLYWESPFSTGYGTENYSYEAAQKQADVSKRQFEICNEGAGGKYKQEGYTSCALIPDASYLVEPIRGVWLLAIDANVYQPKGKDQFDPANPDRATNYNNSGNAGYNAVLTHKKHLIDWLQGVAKRASSQGKQLVSFSHFPMAEFYNGESDRMAALYNPGAFQMARRPAEDTTRRMAATGLRLHFGGHMHFNNTGIHPRNGESDADGRFLVNVQSPALGVFGAAYKILTCKDADTVEVQTIALDEVARFDELFEHYETEWQRLRKSTDKEDEGHLWKHEILDTKSFHAFTRFYFGELSRLRFLDEYWPCTLKEAASSLDAAQMLILSQLSTRVTLAQLKDVSDVVPLTASCAAPGTPSGTAVAASELRKDWAMARDKAAKLAAAAGYTLDDFARITAYEFYGDFHRTVYAGALALRDMGADRVQQYKVLMSAFPASPPVILKVGDRPSDQNAIPAVFQNEFKQVFGILKGLGSGNPSDHFVIDFKNKRVTQTGQRAPSFD